MRWDLSWQITCIVFLLGYFTGTWFLGKCLSLYEWLKSKLKEDTSSGIKPIEIEKNIPDRDHLAIQWPSDAQRFEAFKREHANYPSQDNEGYLPDRGGFKAGWYSCFHWLRSQLKTVPEPLSDEELDEIAYEQNPGYEYEEHAFYRGVKIGARAAEARMRGGK